MRRGFTLGETLVGLAVVSVILTILLMVFSHSLRVWNLTQARSTDRSALMFAEKALSDDLSGSSADTLTVVTDPGLWAVSFLESRRFDTLSGRPVWERLVVYSLVGGQLHRRTWTPPGPPVLVRVLPSTVGFAITQAELRTLCATPDPQRRLIATGVDSVELAAQADGSWRLTLQARTLTQKGVEVQQRQLDLGMLQ